MGRLLRISALVLAGIAVGTIATKVFNFEKIRGSKPDKYRQPKKLENAHEEEAKSDETDMFI